MSILERLLLSFMIVFAGVALLFMACFILIMGYHAFGNNILYLVAFCMIWVMVYYLIGE